MNCMRPRYRYLDICLFPKGVGGSHPGVSGEFVAELHDFRVFVRFEKESL